MRKMGAWLAMVALLLPTACSTTESEPRSQAMQDANGIDPTLRDSAAMGEGETGTPPGTTLRLAHLAPDLGDIDFCYRGAPEDPFIGPVLGGAGSPRDAGVANEASGPLEDASDAGAAEGGDATVIVDSGAPIDAGLGTSIPYLGVSTYLTLMGSGTFEIAIVDAAAQSCGAPRLSGHVTLDAGKRSIVALLGRALADAGTTEALSVVAFTDDPRPDDANARIRFVHAALGTANRAAEPALSVNAVGSADAELPLAAQIEPRHVASASSTPPIVDTLGYHLMAPLGGLTQLRIARPADAGAAAWTSAAASLEIATASIHTAFIVSDDAAGVAVLWCLDANLAAKGTSCVVVRP